MIGAKVATSTPVCPDVDVNIANNSPVAPAAAKSRIASISTNDLRKSPLANLQDTGKSIPSSDADTRVSCSPPSNATLVGLESASYRTEKHNSLRWPSSNCSCPYDHGCVRSPWITDWNLPLMSTQLRSWTPSFTSANRTILGNADRSNNSTDSSAGPSERTNRF